MPLYKNLGQRGGVSAKPETFWTAWFKKRERNKQEMREQAAKMITNKLADNERKFIEILGSIDFRNSQIPEKILNMKSTENQSCGDLEFFARGLQTYLQRNPQVIKCDIRELDKNLMAILLLFRQSVEHGEVNAAYAARYALLKGFNEIRNKIPQEQPELIKTFVEVNASYLDEWITCIGMAQLVDQSEANVKSSEKDYNAKVEGKRELVKKTLETLKKDPEKAAAIDFIKEHDSMADRAKWTDLQHQVHMELVEAYMEEKMLELVRYDYFQQKDLILTNRTQLEQMKVKLNKITIATDPNLMNKYKEAMEQMFKEFAENDVKIQETMAAMDDYSARIEKLYNTRGQQMMLERASEQANNLIKEAQKMQRERMGESSGGQREDIRDKYQIMTDEEEEEYLRKKEEELKKLVQESNEVIGEVNEVFEEEEDVEVIDN